MELRDYIRIVRRSGGIIVVLLLIGIIAAGAAALLQTRQYSATAEDYVSTSTAANASDLSVGTAFAQQVVAGYAHVAGTTYVLQPVITSLRLDTTPTDLAKNIAISTTPATSVLEITATDPSPVQAAAIANAIADRLTVAVDELTPDSQTGTTLVKLTEIEPAATPTSPSSPKLALYLAVGALAGLVVAIVIAVLREVLDTRVRELHDVKNARGLPSLGEVLYDRRADRIPLVVRERPRGVEAEAYQVVRTNLQFLDLRSGSNGVVITSSVPGEGKTLSTANLAITLSRTQRVLLVDADLRRPRIAKVLGIEGGVGLSDVLIGEVKLADAVQTWGGSALRVLPAGRIPPNPADLLRSPAMHTLLRDIQGQYDVVLFDAPPLLSVSDAAVLAHQVAGTIVVCAVGSTRRAQLTKSLDMLAAIDVQVLGLLPTMVRRKRSETYSYEDAEKGGPNPPAGRAQPSGRPSPKDVARVG